MQDQDLFIKVAVLAVYVGILFLIGIIASRRIKSMSDYYVGGKNMGFWAVAFSARATGESGWLLIGLTGMGAMVGYSGYWVVVGELLGVFISWQFMAKRFKRRSDKFGSITIPDYLQSHFKTKTHTLRVIAAAVLVIFIVIYVASQIDVTGVAFNSMLGIDYKLGALIGFFIVLAYIFVGGFVAAVWSDLFQGLLMFIGLVLLPIVVWFSMDYGAGVSEGLNAIDPTLTQVMGQSEDGWMNLFTILGFSMIGLGFLGSPQVYVRFMSIKDEKEIDKGKWVAAIFTLLTDFAAVSIGILARIYFTKEGQDPEAILGKDGEDVLGMLTESFLPTLLVAIFIAIVLSAIMSTIDSLLILASSAITRDFYQKIFRPHIEDENLTKISRTSTIIMAFTALLIAIIMNYVSPDRQIFWVIIFGWSGIAATFCPVIILTLFWKGYSERGAIASMISGFLSVILFNFVFKEIADVGAYFKALDVLAPSFAVAMLVGIIVSKIYPPRVEAIKMIEEIDAEAKKEVMPNEFQIKDSTENVLTFLKQFHDDKHLSKTFEGTTRKGKIEGIYSRLGNGHKSRRGIGYVKILGDYNLDRGEMSVKYVPSNMFWTVFFFLILVIVYLTITSSKGEIIVYIGIIPFSLLFLFLPIIYFVEGKNFIKNITRIYKNIGPEF